MNKFNSFTTYCNAKGNLYISGGEYEQAENDESELNIEFKDFIRIDLDKLILNNELNQTQENFYYNDNNNISERNNRQIVFDITKFPNLLEPRTLHSMTFVPEN